MKIWKTVVAISIGLLVINQVAIAQQADGLRADDHAPIAVMGDHYHEAGEFMLSYRYMHMNMKGNADGSRMLSPTTIATTVPNRFFGMPMQPPTLRVVPTRMSMTMHMFSLMYAPSDQVTLMAMLNHVTKEMEHTTFQGPIGTGALGTFTTQASGLGDVSLAALIRLRETVNSRLHLTAGLSLPLGDTDAAGVVLAPTGMRPTLRLPYPMQLGSGTYDILAGVTYSRFYERWSWGAQWRTVVTTGDNDESYAFGNEHRVTAWYARPINSNLSWSARMEWIDRGNVDGIDPLIVAPVQTADPLKQRASRIDLALGINYVSTSSHRISLEVVAPAQERLDGPQLKTDWQAVGGYQFAF